MSFGLKIALGAFINLMNRVFRDYLYSFVIVLFDDIFIHSKNENEHESHLKMALQALIQHQLYTKFSKCMLVDVGCFSWPFCFWLGCRG